MSPESKTTVELPAPSPVACSDLLCCPFCGEKWVSLLTEMPRGGNQAMCRNCGARSAVCKTPEEVRVAWNNRTLDARWVLRKSIRISANILKQWDCTSEIKILELAKAIGNDLYEPLWPLTDPAPKVREAVPKTWHEPRTDLCYHPSTRTAQGAIVCNICGETLAP